MDQRRFERLDRERRLIRPGPAAPRWAAKLTYLSQARNDQALNNAAALLLPALAPPGAVDDLWGVLDAERRHLKAVVGVVGRRAGPVPLRIVTCAEAGGGPRAWRMTQTVPPTAPPVLNRSTTDINLMPAAGVEIALPPAGGLGALDDDRARRLVARALRRYQRAYNRPAPNDLNAFVQNINPANLTGFCYLGADEVTTYLVQNGVNAKTVHVHVNPSNHFFTVVSGADVSQAIIVDATWGQFYNGNAPRLLLKGTYQQLLPELRTWPLRTDLAAIYEVGLGVLNNWGAYQAFV